MRDQSEEWPPLPETCVSCLLRSPVSFQVVNRTWKVVRTYHVYVMMTTTVLSCITPSSDSTFEFMHETTDLEVVVLCRHPSNGLTHDR